MSGNTAHYALEILTEARGLIASPETWVQAIRENDFLENGSPGQWTAYGAIEQAFDTLYQRSSLWDDSRALAYELLSDEMHGRSYYDHEVGVETFNDTRGRTHGEVLTAFDGLIRWMEG